MVLKSLCGVSSSSLFIFSTGVTGGGGWGLGQLQWQGSSGPSHVPYVTSGWLPLLSGFPVPSCGGTVGVVWLSESSPRISYMVVGSPSLAHPPALG